MAPPTPTAFPQAIVLNFSRRAIIAALLLTQLDDAIHVRLYYYHEPTPIALSIYLLKSCYSAFDQTDGRVLSSPHRWVIRARLQSALQMPGSHDHR